MDDLLPAAIATIFGLPLLSLLLLSYAEELSTFRGRHAAPPLRSRLGQLLKSLLSPYFKWCGLYPHDVRDPASRRVANLFVDFFGYREIGRFVDIGCGDGETGSLTAGLADVGWSGVCVEAVPEGARAARARHAANEVRGVARVMV